MPVVILYLFVLLGAFVIYVLVAGPTLPPHTDRIIASVIHSELPEVIRGKTGFASSAGLDIWYECIAPEGAAKGTVLLLMAMASDALVWPPEFVRAFVDSGYQVIRYDHRGTGMSDWVKHWDRKNPYPLADMAEDAVEVLNALDIQKAHLVGLSMGGMIAQEVAINHPDRVASLVLMMTSGFIGDPDIPGLTSRYFLSRLIQGIPLLKYHLRGGEKNLIKERLAKTIMVAGEEGLDIREIAEVVLYDLRKRRGINVRAIFQHQTAIAISGSRYERLKTLNIPTLVIHGTADLFIPVEHGRKLVEVIPGARGLWLDGVDHVFPVPNMDAVMRHIIAHLDSGSNNLRL